MIFYFKNLGKSIFKNNDFDRMSSSEKMVFYLLNQSIVPIPKQKDKAEFAIAIHFDTQKNQFRFEEDKEIRMDNRAYFLAFPVGAPRDKKKLLITNSIEPLYSNIFIDAIEYLKKKRKEKKIKTQIHSTYDNFLREMHDTFYLNSGKKSILNRELMAADQKEECDIIAQELLEKQKKSDPVPVENIYKKFIEKNFSENIQIALIKIDGKTILEHEHREDYIQLVYYDLFERFFIEDGKKDILCHLCQTTTECTGKISFPMKFFGTTNELFFNDLDKKKRLNSFAICRTCLQEVLTGMKYVSNELNEYLLGIPCYLIPALDKAELKFEKKYKKIFKLLKTENKSYQDEINEINTLITKSEKSSFAFSFLFYDSPPGKQEFTILKLISHLEYRQLKEYLGYFDYYNDTYKLNQFEKKSVHLVTMKWLLFPYQQKKLDIKKFRKDVLDLFSDFVYGNSISYNMCIRRFMNIFKHNFHDNNIAVNRLAAFQMIILLSVFYKINPLKGVKKMSETHGRIYTKIHEERMVDFFETHKEIYENQYHRQGLFLLGTLINTIVNEQLKKRDKEHGDKTSKNLSSTFMKKLNYQGISPRRVHRLVSEVKNYAQIYGIYEPKGIWGNIMDRLQGIEMSRLNNDEIVFYILTGISFSNYLAMEHSMNKKGEN